jgi:acetylornithine deacetylase
MVDSEFLKRTLLDLVAINSINPSLVEGGAGEAEIAAFTVTMMETLGMEAHLDEVAPGRFNAVGIRRGLKPDGRKLLYNAHMDTVGLNGMQRPFQPEIVGGRVFGRGSQDMKGSLAAMLAAVKALNDSGVQLEGDLILAGVADEEWGSLGSEHLVKNYPADAAIVAEPSDLSIATAHRGFIGFEVETTGRAAHGSRYQDGIDAILLMGAFLHELSGLERELVRREPHPLVGPPSLHASTIHGGDEMSTYPASCKLMIERRTVPGETVEQAMQELQDLLDRCKRHTPNFEARLTRFIDRPPFELAYGGELLRTTQIALQERTGRPANPQGVTFWTDAAILAEAGIPSLILGPVGKGLHSAEEWVDLQSCVDLAAVLADVARKFCGEVG